MGKHKEEMGSNATDNREHQEQNLFTAKTDGDRAVDLIHDALEHLKRRVPTEVFNAWCRNLRLEGTPAAGYRVLAHNSFEASWLQRELGRFLLEALQDAGVREPNLRFLVGPSDESPVAGATTQRPPEPQPRRDGLSDLPVARTFESKRGKDPEEETRPLTASELSACKTSEITPTLQEVRPTYIEGNYARLPFSVVKDKDIKTVDEILIDRTVRTPRGEDRKIWRVTAGKSGMPGPFDRMVFRALEKLGLDESIRKRRKLEGPVFFHVKTIIELLRLRYNTQNVRCVSTAFDRLQELSIEDAGCFRRHRSGRKGGRNKVGLIDWVKAAGDVSRAGGSIVVTGTYAVKFSDDYENSVNSGYVRPLDWDFWLSLKRPISQRLVEILEPDFFGLHDGPHVAYPLDDLRALIPIRTNRWLSDAIVVLDRGHKELSNRGFLTWSWDLEDKKFPRVLYRPAEQWHSLHKRLGHDIEVTDVAVKLASELGEPARAKFYQQILSRVPGEYVNEALQDLRSRAAAGTTPDNPAAWFVGSLKKILVARGLDLFPLA